MELFLFGYQSPLLCLLGLRGISVGTDLVKRTGGSGENGSLTLGMWPLISGFHVLCPSLKTKHVGECFGLSATKCDDLSASY